MKIVVIGGSGLIGSNVVARLRRAGHEVVAASPRSGVDVISGHGAAALWPDVIKTTAVQPCLAKRGADSF